MFDEAHKAKNFNSSKEELSTKVSQAVIKIQVISVRVLCMLACFKDAAGRHRDPGDGCSNCVILGLEVGMLLVVTGKQLMLG